ncbi:MAG: hypothetical protein Q4615_02860 [Paracoccus aminovorans]|nr:hypothetical protein [Paracoccus aminovorans]
MALLVLLSLVFVSGTMRAALPDQQELRVQELALAGVSPHELCLTGDQPAHKHQAQCLLCLPMPPVTEPQIDLRASATRYHALVVLPMIRRAHAHRHDPMVPPRGPPAPGQTV